MGCATGHLAHQSNPPTTLGNETHSMEAAKVPEVLSSLERLSQATGGMEKSWYRCIFPFGIISMVIGAAGTGRSECVRCYAELLLEQMLTSQGTSVTAFLLLEQVTL
uniref:Uncharacterized protein n=1 Tax=Knipowitschia caucasica TaxID=637954 RepID=A0AAV2KLP3_KNICA